MNEQLMEDIDLFENHAEMLIDELESIVCSGSDRDGVGGGE
jgi:hypothetical protein